MSLSASSMSHQKSLAFGPDGTQLVVPSHNGLELFDTRTGWTLAQFRTNMFSTESVAFSPDGKLIASGHNDGTIRLWEVPDSVRKPVVREVKAVVRVGKKSVSVTAEAEPELTIPVKEPTAEKVEVGP